MNKVEIMGIGFDPVGLDTAFSKFLELFKKEENSFIVTPNPEFLMEASKNKDFHTVLNSADMAIPDGVGVIYAAKILKKPLKTRVPGIDLMDEVLKFLAINGKTYFLFGAKEGVAKKAAKNIDSKYAGIKCVGIQNGYFDEKDESKIIEKINMANPDVLFVGLGAPKQEMWVHKHLKDLNSSVSLCIGGAIDVYSGGVKRAPKWVSKIGFEWLYRAIIDPKRFKRIAKLPLFLLEILKIKYSNKNT